MRPSLSILEINTLTLKDLYFWLAEKGLSKKHRQNIMDALHQIMKQAFEETRLPLPKFPDYKEKKHERSIPDFISKEDQDLVIENTPSIHRPIVRMIAYHGLRQYEARNLKIADFTDDRTVNVETAKCGPPRRILLDPLVIKDLKSIPRCLFHQFLFHHNGKPYAKTTLWKIIRKALNETGLNHITPSEFGRHSHATHILQRGGSTRMAQEILGHADIRTTERYTHVLVDDQATVSRIASS